MCFSNMMDIYFTQVVLVLHENKCFVSRSSLETLKSDVSVFIKYLFSKLSMIFDLLKYFAQKFVNVDNRCRIFQTMCGFSVDSYILAISFNSFLLAKESIE